MTGRTLALAVLVLAFRPQAGTAQWAEGAGNWWAKVSFFHHQTTEQFRPNGDKRPFLNDDAESRSNAVFLDVLYGVTDRLDVWVQVPYFDLRFDDVSDDRRSTGVGDIRLSARYNLFQFRGGSLPVSVRYTAKLPVAEFPFDAEIIPVGEGQWDHEAWLEAGTSFWPVPAYGVVWLGYRWRLENEETTRDPGNEFLFLAELGGTVGAGLGGKVVLDGIFGTSGSIQGIDVSGDEREILYLQPTLTYEIASSTALELGSRFPLQGKNFPAGPQFTIGVFHRGGSNR